uniref:Uncharacterized protein n=1 Tax=Micrurus paraensis TaxID=1970185 RepID=A0A2D4JVQ0_9SAUR
MEKYHNEVARSTMTNDMNQTNGKGHSWFISSFNAAKEKMNQVSAYQLNSYAYGYVQMLIFIYGTYIKVLWELGSIQIFLNKHAKKKQQLTTKYFDFSHILCAYKNTFYQYQLDWPVDQLS